MESMLQIKLFGRFQLTGPQGPIDIAGAKLSAFAAYLALATKPVARDQLTILLWGSHFEEQARQSFRQALMRVRKLLGRETLIVSDHFVGFAPDCLSCDVTIFERLAEDASPTSLRQAVALASGELLAGIDVKEAGWEDWIAGERRRIGALVCKVLQQLGEIDLAEGHLSAALSHAEAIIARDPLHEEGHRLAMRALAATGRRADALRLMQALSDRLARDLKTKPEASTLQLGEEIRSGNPSGIAPAIQPAYHDRPSIAVMPFINKSGDAEQKLFSDGVTEDIITELARFRSLFVAAQNASFRYRDEDIDVRRVGRELGVQYIVEGSVRRMGNQVRITAQLIDASSGNHLWSERYDRSGADLFGIQDELTRTIVATVFGRVEDAEIGKPSRGRSCNLDAYDSLLRGIVLLRGYSADDNRQARELFESAISMNPRFALAHAYFSLALLVEHGYHNASDPIKKQALNAALTGVRLDPGESRCHQFLAMAYLYCGKFKLALTHFERMVSLNPNEANGISHMGYALAIVGRAAEGVEWIRRAMVLNPYHPDWYWGDLAVALYAARRYDEALEANRRLSTRTQYWHLARMAACCARLERMEEARMYVAEVLRLKPDFHVAGEKLAYKNTADAEHVLDGMRKAGLPD
jgi:TolB-like protein/DNA-binding SARP family transcriptional activator/Flp pilus assembly protein TadD